jgi:hypothetical protein
MTVFAKKRYILPCFFFTLFVVSTLYTLSQQNVLMQKLTTSKTTASECNCTSLGAASVIQGPTFRAALAHWMGPMNLAIYEAWIVYHHQRWRLTDVDFHVHWTLVDQITEYFSDPKRTGGARVKFFGHYVPQDAVLGTSKKNSYGAVMGLAQKEILQRTLANAKRDGNEFSMFIDADEFLDSNQFESIESVFANNETIAVTIPLVYVDYRICSGVNLTFDSLGYQEVRPFRTNFIDDEENDFHTDSPIACFSNRKYIVRVDGWNHLTHIHDPVKCMRSKPFNGIIDMTGRTKDHQHLRVLHLRTEAVGINADQSFTACTKINNCKYFNTSADTCVESLAEANVHLSQSSIHTILAGYPLFDNVDEFVKNATCYAERYPEIQPEFCPDLNSSTCQFTNLYHNYRYKNVSDSEEQKWGCDDK